MPTEKQQLRDKEYYGEYIIGGRYSTEQWEKILSTPVLVDSTDLSILKEIFISSNHSLPLTQLCFHHDKKETYYLDRMNQLGEKLGHPNGFSPEIDLEGNEFWWYLLFWGRITKEGILEWKLQPALAEALENLEPELEKNYTAYMTHLEYCQQNHLRQEDAVWVAATLLLFEKYHLEHPSHIDDLLLMQYEIQQRAQKIYGQDIDIITITEFCNADSARCKYHYLKDIYKYWRITYPNEFEGDSERPTSVDPNFCIMSYFGYLTLQELYDFVDTNYARLANPNFIEINTEDALYKMISFLKENAGKGYMNLSAPTEEQIEHFLEIKTNAKNAMKNFHNIASLLTEPYPNFTQTKKASWLTPEKTCIQTFWKDSFELLESSRQSPSISTLLSYDETGKTTSFFLYFLVPLSSEEKREKILELCNPLTALTSANFHVAPISETPIAKFEQTTNLLCAYVSYPESELLDGGEENFFPQFETVLQIFASYCMNLCEQFFLTDSSSPQQADEALTPSSRLENNVPDIIEETSPFTSTASTYRVASTPPHPVLNIKQTEHEDRKKQTMGKYPKNILLTGNTGIGKTQYAISLAVAIVKNLSPTELATVPYPEILSHYHRYRKEQQIYYTTTHEMDCSKNFLREELIRFSNQIGSGNYVFLLEHINPDTLPLLLGHIFALLAPEKREGAGEEESILLPELTENFSLPSNLYFIATTSSHSLPADFTRIFYRETLTFQERLLEDITVNQIKIGSLIRLLNDRIAYFLTYDYQIGHGILLPLRQTPTLSMLGQIFYGNILPLLEIWFEKDYEKIRFVLGDFKKSSPRFEMIQKKTLDSSLLFGIETTKYNLQSRECYHIQKEAFFLEETYLEI